MPPPHPAPAPARLLVRKGSYVLLSSSQLRVAFWPLDSLDLAIFFVGPTWKANLVPCHTECLPAGASARFWPRILGTRPGEQSPLLGHFLNVHSFLLTAASVLGTQLPEATLTFPTLGRAPASLFIDSTLRLGGSWKHLLQAVPEFSATQAPPQPNFHGASLRRMLLPQSRSLAGPTEHTTHT